jgi:RimJ/RimL family protein N-acetyltransferase
VIECDQQRCREAAERLLGRPIDHINWWTSLGWSEDGEIVAVVLYTQPHEHEDMEMHLLTKPGARWLRREFVTAAFRYPFTQEVVRRVSAAAPLQNKPFQYMLEALGFVREGIKRRLVGGRDFVMFGMLREECRYESWR